MLDVRLVLTAITRQYARYLVLDNKFEMKNTPY
jgi:hypothetical protein